MNRVGRKHIDQSRVGREAGSLRLVAVAFPELTPPRFHVPTAAVLRRDGH